VRGKLAGVDIFKLHHNHVVNDPMFLRQTFWGGLFTIFALLLVFYLAIQSLLFFNYDNVIESKALVPKVIITETAPTITADFDIRLLLTDYGGECEVGSGTCHSEITLSVTGFIGDPEPSGLTCIKQGRSCLLFLTCMKCFLESEVVVDI
jgi:hypothetical protein